MSFQKPQKPQTIEKIQQKRLKKEQEEQKIKKLIVLTNSITSYYFSNNFQITAIDLLFALNQLKRLQPFVNNQNFQQIYLYLIEMSLNLTGNIKSKEILRLLIDCACSLNKILPAFRLALRLDDRQLIKKIFVGCPDNLIKMQLAFSAAQKCIYIQGNDKNISKIMSNSLLPQFYSIFVKHLKNDTPIHPSDIFRRDTNEISMHDFLYNIYGNAFANAGLTKDVYLMDEEIKRTIIRQVQLAQDWRIAAVASIGVICPWSIQTIFKFKEYYQSQDVYVKAGAHLGIGICCATIYDKDDSALRFLHPSLNHRDAIVRECSILGIGMAYAGQCKNHLIDILHPTLIKSSIKQSAFAALALALSFVGSSNQQLAQLILLAITQRESTPEREKQMQSHFTCYYGVALALIFMGKDSSSRRIIDKIRQYVYDPIRDLAINLIKSTSYIGCKHPSRAKVLIKDCVYEVYNYQQKLEQQHAREEKQRRQREQRGEQGEQDQQDQQGEQEQLGEQEIQEKQRKQQKQKKDQESQDLSYSENADDRIQYHQLWPLGMAILGLSQIKSPQDYHIERMLDNILELSNRSQHRHMVPLALALSYLSNPTQTIIKKLNQLTRLGQQKMSFRAIIGLGLVGAGTKNFYITEILQNLATDYRMNNNYLFLIRLSQSLVSMGNGMLSINPLYSEGYLLSKVGMGGILTFIVSLMDINETILGKYHYFVYFLVLSMHPKSLFTIDEKLEPLALNLRVGHIVENTKAGAPKRIAGTHYAQSPALVNCGQQGELDQKDYSPIQDYIFEKFVVVKRNSDQLQKEDIK